MTGATSVANPNQAMNHFIKAFSDDPFNQTPPKMLV
jgi:hypothetical protein